MNHIQQKNNKQNGFFYIEEQGTRVAEVGYTWRGNDVMSVDHTEVSEQLEGKGVGSELMKHLVAYARENGIKLNLNCSFAQTAFKRHPEWSDVL